MPTAAALIVGILLIAAAVFLRLLWAVVLLVPVWVYAALAAYVIWCNRARHQEAEALRMWEIERQREFNEQEFRAWKAAVDGAQRNRNKRDRVLRAFDDSRKPPAD